MDGSFLASGLLLDTWRSGGGFVVPIHTHCQCRTFLVSMEAPVSDRQHRVTRGRPMSFVFRAVFA